MPPLQFVFPALLLTLPALYSISLLVLDTETPPHCRTVRALGSGLLLKAGIVVALGVIGLLAGQSLVMAWLPLLMVTLGSIAALRIMQIETTGCQ